MATKWKSIKADEDEIKAWTEAAKIANEDGRPSFNYWARKALNRAMRRVMRTKKNAK